MTDLSRLADMAEILGAFEWFQWLAEKLEECTDPDELPAYDTYKSWKPTRLTSEL